MAWYWIEWVIEFDLFCKTRKKQTKKEIIEEKNADWKEPCQCEKRNQYNVENKYKNDIIWLIWDSLFKYCSVLNNKFIIKVMNSLLELFCVKYTTACCKRRRYLLYYAVMLLIETVPTNIEIIQEDNKPILRSVVEKIDEIYKQIKKNECAPNTEYLFSSISESNTNYEEMIKKMEIINTMTEILRDSP